MAIRIDPENNELNALDDFADFKGKNVLEIGCGEGRLTWRYAENAAHVLAIDPSAGQIILAKKQTPTQLHGRIEFRNKSFEDLAAASPASTFDIVILSQSLC